MHRQAMIAAGQDPDAHNTQDVVITTTYNAPPQQQQQQMMYVQPGNPYA